MKTEFCFGILAVVILMILISGCSSSTVYTPPTKVETSQSSGESIVQPTEQSSEPAPQIEQPKLPIFKVGETATDNQLKVTVNSVRFAKVINEMNNEFLVAKASAGQEYAIVDLTVENMLSDKTQPISTLMETTVNDQDGYNYNIDYTGLAALSKSFKDGELLPKMKKRGGLTYLVPASATDLKFIYKFDLFGGTSAVFDIK